MIKATCFGEVLWDVFPTHKKIGGAPLNVAVRLESMQNETSIISKIGNDKKGRKLIDFLRINNVDTTGVQIDSEFKTGKVKVVLDDSGSASYTINHPRAWDKIELTPIAQNLAKDADVFIYGSLASRDEVSRNTLYELLKIAKYKVFDVNLRKPHYTAEVLSHLMNEADFIKFNDDEIYEIADLIGPSSPSFDQTVMFIAEQTNTKCICVTRGSQGAVLYFEGVFYYNSGYQIVVVDTVGAGDSFLATLINKIMKKSDPQDALDYACAIGALVASHEGANPIIEEEEITNLMGKSLT